MNSKKWTFIKTQVYLLISKLTFTHHVNFVTARANRVLGLMWRNCRSLDTSTKRFLYLTLVRPSLDFCSVVFNSISKTNSKRIDRIHFRFLRFISPETFGPRRNEIDEATINLLNKNFNVLSPSTKRVYLDLLFLFKCVNSFDCNLISYFSFKVPCRQLRQCDLFSVPFCRVNVCKNGFISRLSSLYNDFVAKCPDVDIFSNSLYVFKCHLNNYLM